MLVLRKGVDKAKSVETAQAAGREPRPGAGGPVFLPRRKPSALAERLLAHAQRGDRLASHGEPGFAGRPGA